MSSTDPRAEDVAEAIRTGGALPDGATAQRSAGDRAPTGGVPLDLDGDGTSDDLDGDGIPEDVRSQGGGVTVRVVGAPLTLAMHRALVAARADGVPAALAAGDATLWGSEATPEATVRLGWLHAHEHSRELLPRLAALREELLAEGLDRVVLCGMGGSSLAPEVITRTAGAPLVVLDTTDPHQVRAAVTELERTVVVVASKSGGTVETDSHARAFLAAFASAGIDGPRRLVAVTDPGSPLAERATSEGWRAVLLADPDVGGRYSALTAFGLVPSALAGVDVAALLDEAAALSAVLGDDRGNPALVLGSVLGGAAVGGRDKLVLAPGEATPEGFGDWAEQLVAESTGKDGKGLLPVVVESVEAPGTEPALDTHLVALGGNPGLLGTSVTGPLGAQFLLWEYATALAGRVLRINPFDQPNVAESKANTQAILDAGDPPALAPVLVEGAVEVHGDAGLLGGVTSLAEALDRLLGAVPDRGYLAVLAYLDRGGETGLAALRPRLAARLAHPVTFGWGPRFLHSTGQYHKGGPQVGAFLQVTGAVTDDLEVPGRPYTFGRLQAAQAAGDLAALAGRGRPVVRLHLTDRAAGVEQLLAAAGAP